MNDICCIGHITLDKIVTPKQTAYMPGGTSYYFSHGISHLKDTKHYKLVTALAPTEFKAVEDIRAKGIEVKVIPSRHTVYFENIYGENQDNRTQRLCCNNSWDFSKLPVVEHFNYKEIMITGGEPLLFPEKLSNLAESIRTVQKLAYGNKGKLFLYTALADMLPNYIRYFDGVVYTPHSANDVHSLLKANNFLLDYKDELMESKSLRLNLFPDIKKHIPDNTDLSLWKVKDMQWIKDCPVPADEEFKRVAELWEVE